MRTATTITAVTIVLLWQGSALAQGNFTLSVSDVNAPEGLIYQQDISLEVLNDATVSGWSFSVCHDNTQSDVCGGNLTQFVFDLNPIGPLFFVALSIDDRDTVIPGSQDGLNCGLVLDQNGFFFFPDNTSAVCVNAYYIADPGTAGSSSTTSICSTVGSPNVEAVVVCCGGASIGAGPNLTTVSGTVNYVASDDHWAFGGSHVVEVGFDSFGAVFSFTESVGLTIANTAANVSLTEGAGFSLALSYDPTFVSINSITPSATLAALNGGSGPDVFVMNDTGTGFSAQVQNTALPMIPVLPYNPDLSTWSGETAVDVELQIDTSSLMGMLSPTVTHLSWGDLGDGSTNSMTVICGDRNLVGLKAIDMADVEIQMVPQFDLEFVRGDCNDDGAVNIADGIWTISGYLASPPLGPEGPCFAACDVNADDAIDVADVSYLFTYRFGGGPQPPAPFPVCNTESGADCDEFFSCP